MLYMKFYKTEDLIYITEISKSTQNKMIFGGR